MSKEAVECAPAFPKGVSQPAIRALATIGITRWEQTDGLDGRTLLALHGFGPKAIRILNEHLTAAGLNPIRQ
jgi:hypothetical protein